MTIGPATVAVSGIPAAGILLWQESIPIPVGWPSVGIAALPVLSVLIMQFFQYLATRRQAEKIATVEKKVDSTHTLVNSGNQVQLELIVAMATELAEKEPDNQAAQTRLAAAKKALADHKIKQAVVDDRGTR